MYSFNGITYKNEKTYRSAIKRYVFSRRADKIRKELSSKLECLRDELQSSSPDKIISTISKNLYWFIDYDYYYRLYVASRSPSERKRVIYSNRKQPSRKFKIQSITWMLLYPTEVNSYDEVPVGYVRTHLFSNYSNVSSVALYSGRNVQVASSAIDQHYVTTGMKFKIVLSSLTPIPHPLLNLKLFKELRIPAKITHNQYSLIVEGYLFECDWPSIIEKHERVEIISKLKGNPNEYYSGQYKKSDLVPK